MKIAYMHQVYMGTIGDLKNLEEHFSRMARRGWMIDKIGLFTHRYRAIKPCNKRFFVDLMTQITAFDYPENEDVQDYRSICEASGWTFVAANKQFHVFCADGENTQPIPIHTDNTIQAQNYLKASRKYELPWFFYALLMFWLSSPFGKGVELFLSNISLFMAIGYCFFLIGYAWTFGLTLRWYIQTKRSAKNDLPLPIVNYRLAKLRNNVLSFCVIMFLLCMIAGVCLEIAGGMNAAILLIILMPLSGIGVGLWIRRQIDTKQRTRKSNIGLSIITSAIFEIILLIGMGFATYRLLSSSFQSDSLENRPVLMLNDVGAPEEANNSNTRINGTVAVPVDYEHWEINRQGDVRTQVYCAINTALTHWLYKHFSDEFYEDFDAARSTTTEVIMLTPDEAAFWGAKEGIAQFYKDSNAAELLLIKGKTILRLSIGGENMRLETVSEAVQNLWNE